MENITKGEQTPLHYQLTDLEKWAFRTVLALLIMLVSWVSVRAITSQDNTAKSVNDLTEKVAVFSVQLGYISGQVSTTSSLSQQVALIQQLQQDHEKRLQRLEEIELGGHRVSK
jgi:hypothetical protein